MLANFVYAELLPPQDLGDLDAWADGRLTAAEMAADPEAADLLQALQESIALNLGVDPSQIAIQSLMDSGLNEADLSLGSQVKLDLSSDFASTFGTDEAFADCYLTPEEIAHDPEAALFAATVVAQLAATGGLAPEDISIAGITTDEDEAPGCQGSVVASTMHIDVSGEFARTFGSRDARVDCYLSPDEIAGDPDAAAFVQAFIEMTAATAGIVADDILVSGITTDGDETEGCQGRRQRRRLQLEFRHRRSATAICQYTGGCTVHLHSIHRL